MDDLDALSLLDLPLELDQWLLDEAADIAAEGVALIPRDGAPIAREWKASASLKTEAVDVGDQRQPEPLQALAEPQRIQDREHKSKPVAKRARRGKSSSQRQKEEIANLHQQAGELQAQAACLRGVDPASMNEDPSSLLALGSVGVRSVWMDIAKRQKDEEKRAKEVNAKLRDALVAHAKFVQRLDRVLRKAEDWTRESLPMQVDRLASDPSREDHGIFLSLARSIEEQVFPQFDDIMGRPWRLSLPDEVSGDRLHMDFGSGHFAEMEDTTLFPFSHRLVDEVTWRSMRDGKLQFGLRADASITPADNMLACQISMLSGLLKRRFDSDAPAIKTYLVIKRYQQAGRIVYAWESLALLPELKDLQLPPARLVGRGWAETAPQQLRNGTEGCATRSCMEWYVRDQSGAKELAGQGAVGIVNMLTEEHNQSRAKISQSLENLLLDEAVRKKKQGARALV